MHMLEEMGSYVLKRVPSALPRSRRGILEGIFRIACKRQYRCILIFHFDTFSVSA